MQSSRMLVAILLSAGITFGLRAVPFLVFGRGRTMPPRLAYLGKILPPAIMAVLVVYCLKDVKGQLYPNGLAELAAAGVVVLTYKWRHNTLLSILFGTICNMVLIRIL